MKRLRRRIRRQFERGASIQTRIIDPTKAAAFLVRWREVIQGRLRHKSKSFSDPGAAGLFRERVRAKLKIAHEAETLMTGEGLRPRDILLATEEYVGFRRGRSIARSLSAYNLRLRLLELIEIFKWKLTTDIPATSFALITAHYGADETFLVRESQLQLLRFVRWARKKYLFRSGIEDQELSSHEEKLYYIWTDAEKDRILAELAAPEEPIILDVDWSARRCDRERRRIKDAFQVRQALHHAIWIQMRWALRPGEVCRLTVKDWNSATQVLTIPGSICKTKKTRQFRVCPETVSILNGLVRGRSKTDPLFVTARGRAWQSGLMSRQFKRSLDKLGLAGVLYSCRHFAATTLMVVYKGQTRKVMRITGHTTLKNLERYLLEKEDRMAEIPPEFLTPSPYLAGRLPSVPSTPAPVIPCVPILSYGPLDAAAWNPSLDVTPPEPGGAAPGVFTRLTWSAN